MSAEMPRRDAPACTRETQRKQVWMSIITALGLLLLTLTTFCEPGEILPSDMRGVSPQGESKPEPFALCNIDHDEIRIYRRFVCFCKRGYIKVDKLRFKRANTMGLTV